MMAAQRKLLFLAFLLSYTHFTYAQGCSDAGFCTLNGFKPQIQAPDSLTRTDMRYKIGASFGSADHDISIVGLYLEYHLPIDEQFAFDLKTTFLGQDGNGIAAFDASDFYVNGTHQLGKSTSITAGIKIPFTKASKKEGELPLPMDYQSSLGTYDLILGVGHTVKKLQWVLALQQPLNQNKNAFLAENYPEGSPLRAFQSTNQFKRSGDVLLRAFYPLQLAKRLTLTPGLLGIYHLADDRYTDAQGVEREIIGSQGFTLNGNFYADYALGSDFLLQLNFGMPFVVRDARPDGLTRSFVLGMEMNMKF